MTRDEAEAVLALRRRERPEDGWTVSRNGDAWDVVRVSGLVPAPSPTGAVVESKPKPPQADDPRPALWRDVGGPYGAG